MTIDTHPDIDEADAPIAALLTTTACFFVTSSAESAIEQTCAEHGCVDCACNH